MTQRPPTERPGMFRSYREALFTFAFWISLVAAACGVAFIVVRSLRRLGLMLGWW